MNAKLHLGVAKRLDGDTIGANPNEDPTGVFARIVPMEGRGQVVQALVPVGNGGPTSAIDVPAGRLSVQVRLPSGETLTGDLEVPEGGEAKMVLSSKASQHEWLSWPRMVSSVASSLKSGEPDADVDSVKLNLWTRGITGDIAAQDVQPSGRESDRQLGVLSCTFRDAPSEGVRSFLAVDIPGPGLMLATIPLPWNNIDRPNSRPTTVQVVVRLGRDEASQRSQATGVDVLVQDTWMAPMLGYLHAGDLAAVREFESSVRKNAEQMLFSKGVNPLAAAAGGYLLLQTRALDQMHDWARNLAQRFEWLPDGPILWATQLLRSREGRREPEQARRWLREGARRGVPVFTEGVRLLGEGMRTAAREDKELAGLIERLEAATRPDALFTVLEAEEPELRQLVRGFQLQGVQP